jgi:hypothetical protein
VTPEWLELEIVKWADYHPRNDVKRPSWFRVEYRMLDDPDFYGFSHEEFKAWMFFLAQACRKNDGRIRINFEHADRVSKLSRKGIIGAAEKLQSLGIVLVADTQTLRERHAGVTDTNSTEREREIREKPRIGIRAAYSEEFEKTWEAYGRVGKKADAAKAFEELGLSEEETQDLLKAIARYTADCRRKERSQQYLGTFLREDWRPWLPTLAQTKPIEEQGDFDRITRINEAAYERAKKAGLL